MRITFLGGADEVGASGILLEMDGRRVLVDAGIRPSPKARWGLAGDQLPDLSRVDAAGGLDAVLVTHAHTDHTGALELVTAHYPDCPVYATPMTIALMRVLHQDARRIMQSRLDEEGELPLFDDLAVQKLMAACVPVPFHTRLPLGEGLVVTFYPAGHIAGAAMVGLASDEGRVLISGDVSVSPQRTVDGLTPPPFRPDVLILESTYGGRLHANRAAEERRLAETVGEVTAAGGKVLIPAFALGRAQELLLILNEQRHRGVLPGLRVWADGMVRAVCQAYASFPEALPLPLQERGAQFFDEYTRPVERPDQRNALVWQPEPLVIIASSGMLAGGPARTYARALAGAPQHAILLTGYQDEESPGRRLQEMAARGKGTLRLGQERVDVQCRLGTYALSAHADEGQLISLAQALDPSDVVLVHGDAGARESLGRALAARGRRLHLPAAGQQLEFHFRRASVGFQTAGRARDVRALWSAVAAPGGGYFTARELAAAWQGPALDTALERDGLYFERDAQRPELYRARTQEQVDARLRQRARMAALEPLAGQVLALRGEEGPRLARCAAAGPEDFRVEGEERAYGPEDVLGVAGPCAGCDLAALAGEAARVDAAAWLSGGAARSLEELLALVPLELAPGEDARRAVLLVALERAGAERGPEGYVLRPAPAAGAALEPNQALAVARAAFPPEARLRKAGYHVEGRTLALTFDFPDTARLEYADLLAGVEAETGWRVAVDPEANQAALAALAREVLPAGWDMVKGPAIHREEKRVTVTVRTGEGDAGAICARFGEISGYALTLAGLEAGTPATAAPAPVVPAPSAATPAEGAWEINAAYHAIRAGLAGSTLYRLSLKGNTIVLAFMSPQVGARYAAQIETLSRRTGWRLAVHPAPNQAAILQAAQAIAGDAGWTLLKGPGIHIERGEVEIVTAAPVDAEARAAAGAALEARTGYRLAFGEPGTALGSAANPAAPPDVVQLPVARIRLTARQESLALNPDKLRRTIERSRRAGRIDPPLQVRRARDGYILLDGMYRLETARALGWEQVAAVVAE